jgi:hypothetical protein
LISNSSLKLLSRPSSSWSDESDARCASVNVCGPCDLTISSSAGLISASAAGAGSAADDEEILELHGGILGGGRLADLIDERADAGLDLRGREHGEAAVWRDDGASDVLVLADRHHVLDGRHERARRPLRDLVRPELERILVWRSAATDGEGGDEGEGQGDGQMQAHAPSYTRAAASFTRRRLFLGALLSAARSW